MSSWNNKRLMCRAGAFLLKYKHLATGNIFVAQQFVKNHVPYPAGVSLARHISSDQCCPNCKEPLKEHGWLQEAGVFLCDGDFIRVDRVSKEDFMRDYRPIEK